MIILILSLLLAQEDLTKPKLTFSSSSMQNEAFMFISLESKTDPSGKKWQMPGLFERDGTKSCYRFYLYSKGPIDYERISWCSIPTESYCIPDGTALFTLDNTNCYFIDKVIRCKANTSYCKGLKLYRIRELEGPFLECKGKGCTYEEEDK